MAETPTKVSRTHDSELAKANQNRVLAKALSSICSELKFSQASLSQVLGLSEASVSRLMAGKDAPALPAKSKELALLFVRVFESLDAIFDNQAAEREWFTSYNKGLVGVPSKLVLSAQGMVNVLGYLEFYRGGF